MHEASVAAIAAWVTEAGLNGASEFELLCGFCSRLADAGVPLARALLLADTLHPVYEGRVFRWQRVPAVDEPGIVEYGRLTEDDEADARWRRSPFYHMLQTGASVLRRNLARGDSADFAIIAEVHAQGQTDYLALIHRFAAAGIIGEMDCIYSAWSSDAPAGFSDGQVEALGRLVPTLALAIKCASLARIAGTLVETYLGRDAGRRVLAGRIARGVAERIRAVLWFSDLRGYTRMSDTVPPEQIIPLLNDYADAIISAIHEAGGDVLKLIGDGTLAVFNAPNLAEACRCALVAGELARARIIALDQRRTQEGLPVCRPYLGLHIGEVFFGNIGSRDRLDFTVVGPAVNEAARIAAMCASVDQDVLLSSAFVAAAGPECGVSFVSVGRYALRGVARPQDLYTLEWPDDRAGSS